MGREPHIKPLNRLATANAKVLFLGYNRPRTTLIDRLIDADMEVWHTEDEIVTTDGYDFVISFGYRHILTRDVIDQARAPLFNLHMSYLPYNRGAHPNFWSFYDATPSGVSIHLMDYGIDTGDLIDQRLVDFDIGRQTFAETYEILVAEMERLFLDNFERIRSGNFTTTTQPADGTYHRMAELPAEFRGWDCNIAAEIERLKQLSAVSQAG